MMVMLNLKFILIKQEVYIFGFVINAKILLISI